jgi:hypothetical protein
MRVLIACEFSGIVRDAFRARGHDAVSCDLLPSEREGPHIQGDVLAVLGDGWDMMIAHPPCTYLCRQGQRWMKHPAHSEGRPAKQKEAVRFFKMLYGAHIPRICVENPVGILNTQFRKPDQIIQPWQFGHDYSKKTCLWLRGLPPLVATNVVQLTYITTPNGKRFTRGWYEMPRKGTERSRTFQGIADAMAAQWGAK